KLPETIYAMIRDLLINYARYPSGLRDLKYDADFAIRGLHYGKKEGEEEKGLDPWLLCFAMASREVLDSLYNIQLETIHRGREQLHDLEEVFALHHGQHVSADYVINHLGHLNDMFSIPEACLLADVTQYFIDHDIPFHPRYLAEDIRRCAETIHKGNGLDASPLHSVIMADIDSFLGRAPKLVQHLESLKSAGKNLFLLTNSGFEFVKPSWYSSNRPFRRVDTRFSRTVSRIQPWEFVSRFEEGQVYSGGNLDTFSQLTGWYG
ncbi:hypothetical protein EV182_005634, partial [Spiromyces aspiralis]